MKQAPEENYLLAAPIFAVYLSETSPAEALKKTYQSLNFVQIDDPITSEVHVYSFMPNAEMALTQDKREAVRTYGYAATGRVMGGDPRFIVTTFLMAMKARLHGVIQAKANAFEGMVMGLSSVIFIPLYLLFLWAMGMPGLADLPPSLFVVVTAVLVGTLAYVTAKQLPRNIEVWKFYGVHLPAAVALGLAASAVSLVYSLPPSLGLVATGVYLLYWALYTGRLDQYSWWHKIVAVAKDYGSALESGVPPEVAKAQLTAVHGSLAIYAVNFVSVPSRLYKYGLALFHAFNEAGFNQDAAEYMQFYIDRLVELRKRILANVGLMVGLGTAAFLIVGWAMATALKALPVGVLQETGMTILNPQDIYVVRDTYVLVFSVALSIWLLLMVGILFPLPVALLTSGVISSVAAYVSWLLFT